MKCCMCSAGQTRQQKSTAGHSGNHSDVMFLWVFEESDNTAALSNFELLVVLLNADKYTVFESE